MCAQVRTRDAPARQPLTEQLHKKAPRLARFLPQLGPFAHPPSSGDEVIMSIAGHVSRAMLSRYSPVRMEAKRRALNGIATRQREAYEKHHEKGELQE
jgi:hypothetical protein